MLSTLTIGLGGSKLARKVSENFLLNPFPDVDDEKTFQSVLLLNQCDDSFIPYQDL